MTSEYFTEQITPKVNLVYIPKLGMLKKVSLDGRVLDSIGDVPEMDQKEFKRLAFLARHPEKFAKK